MNNEGEGIHRSRADRKAVHENCSWLDSSGIQGASPDGILDGKPVLEAKCHCTKRSLTVKEAVNTSKSSCLEK